MFGLKKHNQKKSKYLPMSDETTFHIEVPYEYPFSMEMEELRTHINSLIERYNKIYRATSLTIYIQKGCYQNGIPSKIEDVEYLINIGNNELSRRVNEEILRKSLRISRITLGVAIISCLIAIYSLIYQYVLNN